MLPRPPAGPRSPLRVAVITFGAIVLFGTMLSLVVFGKRGVTGEDASSPGQQVGQALGVIGLVAAAIAYVIQRRRAPPS